SSSQLPAVERDREPFAIRRELQQHATEGPLRTICLHAERFAFVDLLQDRLRRKSPFQPLEGVFATSVPTDGPKLLLSESFICFDQQIGQRRRHSCEASNITPIIRRKPQELSNLVSILRLRPFRNSLDLRRKGTNVPVAHNVAAELEFSHSNDAFGGFGVQLVLLEAPQNLSKVFLVVRFGFGEDDDVIEVYHYNFLPNEVLEGIIHDSLEGGRSIGKAERHGSPFILAIPGIECRFGDGRFFHLNLVVPRGQIDLGEVLSLANGVQTVLDARQRIGILLCDVVQKAIVDAHPPLSSRFRDEQNRGAPRAGGGSDK